MKVEPGDDQPAASAGHSRRNTAGQPSPSPIVAYVDKFREHTKTVRYRPQGDPKEWEIGEPYIPKDLLAQEIGTAAEWPQTLRITVRWGG